MGITRDESLVLNVRIAALDEGDLTGKPVPYIGWFWRNVDFTQPISLGHIPESFSGFMENNKWGYCSWTITEQQQDTLIQLLQIGEWEAAKAVIQAITPPEIANETNQSHQEHHN